MKSITRKGGKEKKDERKKKKKNYEGEISQFL